MLRDQGLFSQVISWDSRYTDFYSLGGAQEEWCIARFCLQSRSKEFGLPATQQDFLRNMIANKKWQKNSTDLIEFSFLMCAWCWNKAVTSY